MTSTQMAVEIVILFDEELNLVTSISSRNSTKKIEPLQHYDTYVLNKE
jgi:formate-dependent phosphoribosylglycinamide formyltransferase (GAR transformylase)